MIMALHKSLACRKCGSHKGFKVRTSYPFGKKSKGITAKHCRNCDAIRK